MKAGLASHAQAAATAPALACAVYTRKSTEEGLDQQFNSLDAQREACEAFVLSQKSLGWQLVPTLYDDGGFSGGNMQRPGLQRLLADITAGRVKVIVVYKVDRLTRSLWDFSKLVDLFDAQGVSFVSVTQQFNTTTPMGRLTLNMLLTFAQYEREVSTERVRDKIAASKRKGMWMGGVPPVGYRAHERMLVRDEPHAGRIPLIYERYLALNCVRRLQEALEAEGWLTPKRVNRRAGFGGNKPYSRGHLYRILSNPVYRGMVAHRERTYPGQHEAIIEEKLWQAVQERLENNRQGHKTKSDAVHRSLLVGKLVDDQGRRLVPSHARKGNRRYRYYVTPADAAGDAVRLPAGEIEQLVADAVIGWAENDARVVDAVGWGNAKVAQGAITRARLLAAQLAVDPRERLNGCLKAVVVAPTWVRIELDLAGCGVAGADAGDGTAPDGSGALPSPVVIEVAAQLRRCGMAVRLIVGAQAPGTVLKALEPNPALVALMVKGWAWLARLTKDGQGVSEIAEAEKVSPAYVTRLVQVALLSPEIAQAIAQGNHPMDFSTADLLQAMPVPEDWEKQSEVLGLDV